MGILAGLLRGENIKALARPLMYLAAALLLCLAVWQVISWDEARFAAVREDASREKTAAIESRDNHWKAEIERGNREVAQRQTEKAIAAAIASDRAENERAELARQLSELEKANATLPVTTSCGIDRARARLLRVNPRRAPAPAGPVRGSPANDPGGGKEALPRARGDPGQ
jgi:hypothetical protein